MSQLKEQPSAVRDSDGFSDDLVHHFCDCEPEVALCGTELFDGPEIQAAPEDEFCVVCVDLFDEPCGRCGE